MSLIIRGIAVAVILLSYENACADFDYEIINFPDSSSTYVYDINDHGMMVGDYYDSSYSLKCFKYDGISFSDMDLPLSEQYTVLGINNNGHLIGIYGVADPISDGQLPDSYTQYGFQYNGDSIITLYFPEAINTNPVGINNNNQIVGYYQITFSGPEHGFLYDGENYYTIDYPGSSSTQLFGINDSGQIVGECQFSDGQSRGFIYKDSSFSDIEIPGSTAVIYSDIDNGGRVVGAYTTDDLSFFDTWKGFLYENGNVATIDVPEASIIVLEGISPSNRKLVGIIRDGDNEYNAGVVYEHVDDKKTESGGCFITTLLH